MASSLSTDRRLPALRQPPVHPRPSQLLFEAAAVTLISAVVGSQDIKPQVTASNLPSVCLVASTAGQPAADDCRSR
jgi:hypothetical protein